jgi:hypothetical protein
VFKSECATSFFVRAPCKHVLCFGWLSKLLDTLALKIRGRPPMRFTVSCAVVSDSDCKAERLCMLCLGVQKVGLTTSRTSTLLQQFSQFFLTTSTLPQQYARRTSHSSGNSGLQFTWDAYLSHVTLGYPCNLLCSGLQWHSM